jgi:hypothetical protein
MPLTEEISMLRSTLSILRSKLPSCKNKREVLLLRDEISSTREQLLLACEEQAEQERGMLYDE